MQKTILQTNLKAIRKSMGLSVAKFSQKIDIPSATLICYERGDRTPSANLFIQLHNILNINLNWFVTGNGEMYFNKIGQNQDDFALEVRKILKQEGLIK